MISCLLVALDKNSHKQVNYEKIQEVSQEPNENPALLIFHLTEAMTKYINTSGQLASIP